MMTIDIAVQPQPWAQAFQSPRMTAVEAKASADAERIEQERQAQAAEDARHEHCGAFHHGSCAADTFMRAEIVRLQAELARAEQDRDHWYMIANHNDIEQRTFARRRNQLDDELRRQDTDALSTQTTANAA